MDNKTTEVIDYFYSAVCYFEIKGKFKIMNFKDVLNYYINNTS